MGLEEPRGELCAKGRESPLEDPERIPTAAFRCSRWPWPHLQGLPVNEQPFEEHRRT